MEEAFDRMMRFFLSDEKKKDGEVEDLFKDAIAFFDQFKDAQQSEDEEYIKSMRQKMEQVYEKIQEESEKVSEESGIAKEDLDQLATDRSNFSEEQWSFLQEAKEQLGKQNTEIQKEMKRRTKEALPKHTEQKKLRKNRKKGNWMPS